ncbi:7-cyano-7-deazaguanine synthase [subsurface metagenome]
MSYEIVEKCVAKLCPGEIVEKFRANCQRAQFESQKGIKRTAENRLNIKLGQQKFWRSPEGREIKQRAGKQTSKTLKGRYTKENNPGWKGGNWTVQRKYAIEFLGQECAVCKKIAEKPTVHHKDLVSTSLGLTAGGVLDNNKRNLEVLHYKCHSELHKTLKSKPITVLLSGGVDSTTTLYWARKNFGTVRALLFNYGQSNVIENKCAVKQSELLGVSYTLIDVSEVFKIFTENPLIAKSKKAAPDAKKEDVKGPATTWIPGRNLIFLMYAIIWGFSVGVRDLAIGVHTEDSPGYPDTRPEFIKSAELAFKSCFDDNSIHIWAPLIYRNKSQIVKLGTLLGVDFSNTYSCYRGQYPACGKCNACVSRTQGFKDAGLKDPIQYAID